MIDFDVPANNDWLAVNQFTVAEGQHTRRPDVVLFVNGLPLAVIELKNPATRTPRSGRPSSSSRRTRRRSRPCSRTTRRWSSPTGCRRGSVRSARGASGSSRGARGPSHARTLTSRALTDAPLLPQGIRERALSNVRPRRPGFLAPRSGSPLHSWPSAMQGVEAVRSDRLEVPVERR